MAAPETPALRAFVAIPGKTLFARLGDRRIRTYPADWTGEVEPDLVVLPCSQLTKFDAAAIRLPPSAARRLRQGSAALVFDASLEGLPHTPAWAEAMMQVLAGLGVPPGRAVYVTQDRGYRADHLAWAAGHGQAPMGVLEYDYWISRFFAGLARDGDKVFEARLKRFRRRPGSRAHRFVSLNWTPRPAKAFFLLGLMRDGLWDEGWISFGGFALLLREKNRNLLQFAKAMRRQPGFEDLAAELAPNLPALDGLGQLSLGPPETGQDDPNLTGDAALPAYDDAWFSVVTESEMRPRPSRVTEKPFKPLVNFHPAIVLGNPGALAYLRRLGFETFGALFDEAYDDELDPRRRFEMVYAQVRRLCAAPETELQAAEARLAETLEHNARWGLTRMPDVFRSRIDRDFVDALAVVLRQPSGDG